MQKFKRSVLAQASILTLVSSAQAADLSAQQKSLLDDAARYISQAETSFKTAKDGAGPAPVAASKAKLALSRMGGVKTAIANAAVRLQKLPADHADVKAVQERANMLQQSVTAFEESLINPGAPAADKPANAGGKVVKLDYRQRESLKNAEFHVREVTGSAEPLAQLADKVSKAGDPNQIDFRLLAQGMNTIENARRKSKNAADQLANVPADGEGVAEVADELKKSVASIDASEKIIAPIHAKLAGLLDPKNNPKFEDDLKRLSSMSQMYSNNQIFDQNPELAATLVSQAGESAKEHDRIVKEYALLMKQETPQGTQLAGASKYFAETQAAFAQAVEKQKQALPRQIDEEIAAINRMADEAVNEKKPAFFTGGIADRLDNLNGKIALMQSLDSTAGKQYADKVLATRAQMKDKQNALRGDIIAANELPPDRYQAADRKSLEALATDALKKQHPDVNILAYRIASPEWKRETIWRYRSGEWYLVDHSRLQVQLLVKDGDKLAVNRPVNLLKNHLESDSIAASPMDGKDDELPPNRYFPLEKVK